MSPPFASGAEPAGSASLLREAAARWARGDLGGAWRLARRARSAATAEGRALGIGRALRLEADVLLAAGEVRGAAAAYQAAREAFAAEDGTTADLAGCDAGTAACLRARGQLQRAADLLALAGSAYERAGLGRRSLRCDIDRAVVVAQARDPSGAATILGEVLARGDALGGEERATAHLNLAGALRMLGRGAEAARHLRVAAHGFEEAARGPSAGAAAAHQNLGVTLHELGHHREARHHLWVARRTWAALARPADVARCDHNLAVVLHVLGEHERAARFDELARSALKARRPLAAPGASEASSTPGGGVGGPE